MLLDRVYQQLVVKFGMDAAKVMMAKISPVAWEHIIFTGRYHFRNKRGVVNLDELADKLVENLEKYLSGKSA